MSKLVVVGVVAMLFGCGKSASTGDKPGKPAEIETETQELAGIRFAAPKGSSYSTSGDAANPGRVIAGTRYRVEIVKLPLRLSLAGYKESVETEAGASKVMVIATDRGWELNYVSTITAGAASRTIYLQYITVGEDEQYHCRFDDEESPNVSTALAICKSIAKK